MLVFLNIDVQKKKISNFFRNTVDSLETQHHFYRNLYPKINRDIESLKSNWQNGRHVLSRITCHSEPSRGTVSVAFYTLLYYSVV